MSSRSSEMCKMDDEGDIIEIWEVSDKRLSWSPFESAFLISNFIMKLPCIGHGVWSVVPVEVMFLPSSALILGICTEHALNIEEKEKTKEEQMKFITTT